MVKIWKDLGSCYTPLIETIGGNNITYLMRIVYVVPTIPISKGLVGFSANSKSKKMSSVVAIM